MSAGEAPAMLTRRLRVILLEVVKSMNMLSSCLNDIFKVFAFNLSATQRKLLQPIKKTVTFGLRCLAYLGAKLRNHNVCNFSDTRKIEFSTLKSYIDNHSVSLVDHTDFPYL